MTSLIFNPWAWLVTLGLLLGSYGTGRWHQYRSDIKAQAEAKLTASESARLRERAAQASMQRIQDDKDDKYRAIAAERDALLASVRNRPSRLPEPARAACAGATGRELSVSDATFLIGLAGDADRLRASLDACQKREAVSE